MESQAHDKSFIEKFTGSLEDKKKYKQYKARVKALPENYRDAVKALERYFNYFGAVSHGDILVAMMDDLADLFEQGAADGISIRAIVGDDPVAFAEDFLSNYAAGQWIDKERVRLTQAIDEAAEAGGEGQS